MSCTRDIYICIYTRGFAKFRACVSTCRQRPRNCVLIHALIDVIIMQCYTRYIDENERCEYSSGWNELFSSNNLIIFSTYSFVRKKSFFKQLILNRSKQGDSRNNKRRHEREARTFKTIRSSTSNKIIRLDGRETTEYHRNNILQFLATYKLINNILSKNKKPKYSSSP